MRIIAGTLKGRHLLSPAGGIRPTGDRLREALFSYLEPRIEGSVWLDLFAGSGTIGLEALSRGARHVYFNDRSKSAIRYLRRNLEICRLEEGFTISQLDAFRFLRNPPDSPLDFIYLDPPYQAGLEPRLLRTVAGAPPRLSGATILLEHFKKTPVPLLASWKIVRTLKAGDSWVEVIVT